MWTHHSFESGTQVVQRHNEPNKPWLYVYGPTDGTDPNDVIRSQMCVDLVGWLNGMRAKPDWLKKFDRMVEAMMTARDGSSITATGPMIDINPPTLNWRECQSEESINARARLIDNIHFKLS